MLVAILSGELSLSVTRKFIGWNRAVLESAAQYLISEFALEESLDLRNVLLVLPGERAGRRLQEILVDRTGEKGLTLFPPRIVTAGRLAEQFIHSELPLAQPIDELFAWVEALKKLPADSISVLIPKPPESDHLLGWRSLATLVRKLHRELESECISFSEVPKRCQGLPHFDDEARWLVLAEAHARYLEVLSEIRLQCPLMATRALFESQKLKAAGPIVVVGAVELHEVTRRIIDVVAQDVTALVPVPEEYEKSFDRSGALRHGALDDLPLPLQKDQISVVGSYEDQALRLVELLSHFSQRSREISETPLRYDQAVIGIPDPRIAPYVAQCLEVIGVAAHNGAGRPMLESAPGKLMLALGDYLAGPTTEAFGSLIRHTDFYAWIVRRASETERPLIETLDQFQHDRLPARMTGLAPEELERDPDIANILQYVDELVSPLRKARSLTTGIDAVIRFFSAVYEHPLQKENNRDQVTEEFLRALNETLINLSRWSDRIPELTSVELLQLISGEMQSGSIPWDHEHGAVDLLGWLELALDDAETLIITGCNEGMLPESINSDPFLPNAVRRQIGLIDNERRFARDRLLLRIMLESKRDLHLISGRRNSEGEVLQPSRLLFACGREELAQRVLSLYRETDLRPALSNAYLFGASRKQGTKDHFQIPPRPERQAKPLQSVSVTAFRDYLACPYRFYLKHVLRLDSLDDHARELDPAQFGSLAHEVLRDFAQSGSVESFEMGEIESYLFEALDRAVKRDLARDLLPAAGLQIDQLRERLSAFAAWQADWRGSGWKTIFHEYGGRDRALELSVSGGTLAVHGRIDRIDRHDESGEWMIFDYKTYETEMSPERVHRDKEEWIDLQLPIYHAMIRRLEPNARIRLGYILLPRQVRNVGMKEAKWSDDELEDAMQCARRVGQKIIEQEFWPPTEDYIAYDNYAEICATTFRREEQR